jgi:hypothetical protein
MSSRAMLSVVVSLLGCVALLVLPAQGDDKNSEKQQEAKELTPKLFTFQGNDVLLTQALSELSKQTGNQVEDRRQAKEDVKIKLDLKQVTFWQALDAIAKAADARVSLYERDGKIALVEGPHQAIPISYSGLFRTSFKRIDTSLILEGDMHVCIIYLEVAWEPRFRPLFMETKPDSLEIQDDKGRAVEIPEGGRGPAAVGQRAATEVQVRVRAPKRSAAQLSLLKGTLAAIGPTKMLTFTFDKLTKIEKREEARKETQQGVTVQLRQLRSEGEGDDQVWTIVMLLEYPPDGPKFESFQSWIVNNEIFLEKEKAGIKVVFPNNFGLNTEDETESKALIRYQFGDEPDKNKILGKFADWKLVYRTPGRISEIPIPFEFKELPLP